MNPYKCSLFSSRHFCAQFEDVLRLVTQSFVGEVREASKAIVRQLACSFFTRAWKRKTAMQAIVNAMICVAMITCVFDNVLLL